MILEQIKLQDFRNYAGLELRTDPRINLLWGLNAQGKTNLLEAVAYLGLASSFRSAPDRDLIRWGQDFFFLEAQLRHGSGVGLRVTAAANQHRQRRWTLDREPVSRLTDVIGCLHNVVFAPADVMLVRSGPDARRRFLNQQMSQLDQEYCRQLILLEKVLRQRNALLKQGEECDRDLLEGWNGQFVMSAAVVTLRREKLCRLLKPLAERIHGELSGGEDLQLQYYSRVLEHMRQEAGDPELLPSVPQLADFFRHELHRLEQAEFARGISLVGPQRDDILLEINSRPAREFGSQGQQRTAAFALKAAELELARQISGEWPILLLDDVLSELDVRRREQVIGVMRGKAQVFITATDRLDLRPFGGGSAFRISGGNVEG